MPPLNADEIAGRIVTDYAACQDLADRTREAGLNVLQVRVRPDSPKA